ncbi:hypothetical protein GCM10010510_70790 [Streptomyces anandii JCM 4720]|nr:hypothetical protein GCM10010510_70790 [Streptomyces anandii JCM 4720]
MVSTSCDESFHYETACRRPPRAGAAGPPEGPTVPIPAAHPGGHPGGRDLWGTAGATRPLEGGAGRRKTGWITDKVRGTRSAGRSPR